MCLKTRYSDRVLKINMQPLPDIVLDTQKSCRSASHSPDVSLSISPAVLHLSFPDEQYNTTSDSLVTPLVVCLQPPICNRSCSNDSADSGFSESDPHNKKQFRDMGRSPSGVCRHGKLRHSTDSTHDIQLLNRCLEKLNASGFYYTDLTMQEAKKKLRKTGVGTFLIRDSSHPGFLFSLSIKTQRGTTSVRVEYTGGYFRLDSDENLRCKMPRFDCVLKLINFYVNLSKQDSSKCVWLESSGRKDTPVVLSQPYVETPSSLKHLCRKVIHQCASNNDTLVQLKDVPCIKPAVTESTIVYLHEYPHPV